MMLYQFFCIDYTRYNFIKIFISTYVIPYVIQAWFLFKGIKTIQTIKITVTLGCFISLNNADSFFHCKIMPSNHLFLMIYLFLLSYKAYSFQGFLVYSWFWATFTAYWKHLLSFLLIEFILLFLFFIQSGESTYDPPRFRFILWHL